MTSTLSLLFFFNDTATTEIYTLSLHDALPILLQPDTFASIVVAHGVGGEAAVGRDGEMTDVARGGDPLQRGASDRDRKSTRLNSSHVRISYAVFCFPKKVMTKPR